MTLAPRGRRSADPQAKVLDVPALNTALLARQMLAARGRAGVADAIEHLVGMQAQVPMDPYFSLWSRLERFDPADASKLIENREAVRMAVMRGTLHLVTSRDALFLRPAVQPALTRALMSQSPYGRRAAGVDIGALLTEGRRLLEERPRPLAELRPLLAEKWPDHDAHALSYVVHYLLPLVQIPPRGLWRRSGRPTCTTLESWVGRPMVEAPVLDDMVLRYLGAFGPASIRDAGVWSGVTGLRAVFDRLRPRLEAFRDDRGVELFDLPDAPRPRSLTPARVRFLGEYDNVFLSHADRRRIVGEGDRGRFPGAPWRNLLLLDGYGGGGWKIDVVRDTAVLSVRPLTPPEPALRDAVVEEGERLLDFAAAGARHEVRVEP